MPTKILVYAIIFDIMLALLSGAYTHVMPPPIHTPPSYAQIEQQVGLFQTFNITTPSIPILPSFSLGPFGTFPGLTIPSVTLFTISLKPIDEIVAGIIWVAEYVLYVLDLIFELTTWLLTIMASTTYIMYQIPVVGPVLLTIFFIINFIIVWEFLKWLRGYGIF